MTADKRESYEFGSFRLDVAEHTLKHTDGSGNGALPDKAFQTLCVLVRNHGHLVTKDELLAQVWPDTIVEENNLDKCIHAIRHVLGEKDGGPKYIETVRKHGYRFVADVQNVGSNGAAFDVDHRAQPIYSKRLLFAVLGIGVLATFVLAIVFVWSSSQKAKGSRSLFVLPFQRIGPGEKDELLELGIADAIINRLASAHGLTIRSLQATRDSAGGSAEPIEAGKQQKVDYVLASNYQIDDGRIRITSQLINVASGTVEDSFKNDFEFRSMFGAQDAIASELSNRVLQKLDARPADGARDRGTSNEQAYRFYLEGVYHNDFRNREGAQKALDALTRAVEIDANYARAWAAKGNAHEALAGFTRMAEIHVQHALVNDAIERALALDTRNSEAYSVLCMKLLDYDYDPAAAEPNCKKAIELDPNSGIAHQIYSRFLNSVGRHDEAIEEIKIAIDLEPASVFNHRLLGVAYHYARRFDEAAAQLERVVEMERSGPAIIWLTQALGHAGRDAEAFKWWKERVIRNADEDQRREYEEAFQREGWKGVMRTRAQFFEEGGENYFHGAAYHAYVGDNDNALAYLEKAFERREGMMPYVRVDPRFDPIRSDPRYESIMKRAGL